VGVEEVIVPNLVIIYSTST